jgi:GT2 family glycosyltransferase
MAAVCQYEPGARIIVVDDGIDTLLDDVEVVRGVQPFVFARNCNLGIKAAGHDDVILLNDDALLRSPGGFTAMLDALRDHPEYGLCGAASNHVGNRNQWDLDIGFRDEPRMVCFVCVAIPRRTIEMVGLLDERFVAYGFDDDDYCLRVRRAGLKIAVHDGCLIDHGSLRSTFRGDPRTPATMDYNARLFKEKWGADAHAL